jgi:phosphatidylserine decarboxylase
LNPRPPQPASRWTDYFKSAPLYLLPHHAISRLACRLSHVQAAWFKNRFIRWFARRYGVEWSEARSQRPEDYPHFNAFFTRPLRPGARPLEGDEGTVVAPVDGCISQVGYLQQDALFQAKGHRFSATELLGGDPARSAQFRDGTFLTAYLSPRDYHRVHMPLAGRLRETVYIPGRLFSVAPFTTRTVPRLFSRNERLVTLFDTDIGAMAVVLVGAINVSAIETVWSGLVRPPPPAAITVTDHRPQSIELERGAEMGRFNMGSTVILLFGDQRVRWLQSLAADQPVRMGQALSAPPGGAPGPRPQPL